MGDVSITFLGSGDAFGSGGRFQPCILVTSPTCRFLMDCGASSLIAMKKQGISPASIEAIFISHLHGDHFAGIPFFLLDGQFSKRQAPLLIAGPPGLETRIQQTLDILYPGASETRQRFPISYLELPASSPCEAGPLRVMAEPVEHPSGGPSYALRMEWAGRIIAYSGDTQWTEALIRISDGADLFICEASFFEKPRKYHIDYPTLRAHRHQLRCKRMVLTHMAEDMLQRRFDLPEESAEDGKTIHL